MKAWRGSCKSVQFPIGMNGCILIAVMLVRGIDGFGCPNHCFCYEWRGLLRTDCVRRNLFNTFVGFSHETQVLDLSHNVVTILHGNEFLDANLRLLQELLISNNRLHKIDKLSFNGLELLQNLDLSFNDIEYLPPTTFRYNRHLKTLNISHNPLAVKNDGPILSSASLQILDIADCRFKFLTARTFGELTRLEVVNVSRNYIQKIIPEVVEGMKNLKYLDVSKNELPCNDQTAAFLQVLISHGIRFQRFCQISQKMITLPVIHSEEKKQIEVFKNEFENVSKAPESRPNLFDDVSQFFESIPSIYVLLCGIQVGLLTGATVTYFCMRKARKISNEALTDRPVLIDNDSDHLTFALIPLNTPPGTPPSPYHSRMFTEFPLPGT